MWFKNKQKNEYQSSEPIELLDDDGNLVNSLPGLVVENVRQLLTRLRKDGELPKRLAMISAIRGEGVTFLTHALAVTLANDSGAKVCIVDLNWWWPANYEFLDEEIAGLASVLAGEKKLDDVLVEFESANLSLLPAGNLPKESRPRTARSERLLEILSVLDKRFDHLIMDIPAVLSTSDSVPLASLSDSCCMIIRQGVTPKEDVNQALDEISHIPQLGVILNQYKFETPSILLKLVMAV